MNRTPSRQLWDLSHRIKIGTKGFPGCAQIVGWPLRQIDNGNYNMLHVSTDLHTGTHVDAMLHCVADGKDAAALPLAHCVGSAYVLDLQRKGIKGEEFVESDFRPFAKEIQAHGKLIIKTGWARHWDTPEYHDNFPGFSRSGAQYLVEELGIHLIGLEQASVHATDHLEVHRIFFNRQVVIVEGLANVAPIPTSVVELFAVPLNFEGADGSPVRAFCRF
jgi:arylformamidase